MKLNILEQMFIDFAKRYGKTVEALFEDKEKAKQRRVSNLVSRIERGKRQW